MTAPLPEINQLQETIRIYRNVRSLLSAGLFSGEVAVHVAESAHFIGAVLATMEASALPEEPKSDAEK